MIEILNPKPSSPKESYTQYLCASAQIIEDAAVHEQYSRVITPEPAMNEETEDVCALLQQCLDIRQASPSVLSVPDQLEICHFVHAADHLCRIDTDRHSYVTLGLADQMQYRDRRADLQFRSF